MPNIKSIIFAIFILAALSCYSQDIEITFSGTGESTIVDSVIATNLSTDESITLLGSETLILSFGTDIINLKQSQLDVGFFPNPFETNATLMLTQKQEEEVIVTIRNLAGQVKSQSRHYLLAGKHIFTVSFDEPSVYLIDIVSKTSRSTIKAICIESNVSSNSIAYNGSQMVHAITSNLNKQKSQQNEFRLGYNYNDVIHIKASSNGYTTYFTDSPVASKNYEVRFVKCVDLDHKIYGVCMIGDQTWMAENLAYLPSVSSSSTGSTTEKHCYVYGYEGTNVSTAKTNDNYKKYGVLYNLEAAKTACPENWKLPSDEDWKTLEKHQGMSNSDANATGLRNSGDVGAKLKDIRWYGSSIDYEGSGSTGFGALPSGSRNLLGEYFDEKDVAYFWSWEEGGSSGGWHRNLNSNNYGVYRGFKNPGYGFSVRCLKK
jgi:uncharacterized protein (TIGR02145 family)